jgi:hypothetical protein
MTPFEKLLQYGIEKDGGTLFKFADGTRFYLSAEDLNQIKNAQGVKEALAELHQNSAHKT